MMAISPKSILKVKTSRLHRQMAVQVGALAASNNSFKVFFPTTNGLETIILTIWRTARMSWAAQKE